ncbi:MAG: ABC transporter substrate-binding protein [Candidatus Bathyarchaeia archaeon]
MRNLHFEKAIIRLQVVIIAIVVVAAAVAAGVYIIYFYPQGPVAPNIILIGVPAPLTGPGAQMGEPVPWIASYIENAINKEGGIYLEEYGRKIPIKFLVRDVQFSLDLASTIAEELIVKDKVSLIMMPIGATLYPAVAAKAEKYGVPCILHFCPSPMIPLMAPSTYCYFTTWSWFEDILNILEAGKLIKTNNILGVINSAGPIGEMARKLIGALAPKVGYEVVDLGLISPGLRDFSPYIERLKAAKAEVLYIGLEWEEGITFWRQCHEMGYKPKVVYGTHISADLRSILALGGDLGLGLLGGGLFMREYPFRCSITGKTVKELYEMYEKETGLMAGANMGAYAGFEIAVDVIKRAGSLNSDKILRAIANTNLNTTWGNINFKKPYPEELTKFYAEYEPELLTQMDHTAIMPTVVGQWFKEDGRWVIKIVYVGRWKEVPVQAKIIPIPGSE